MIIQNLVDHLKACDEAYYNTGNVLVDNDTYDALVATLQKLDPENPYLQKVGATPGDGVKVGRTIPMGTLAKCHKEEEVLNWLAENPGVVLMAPKYDGFGVELLYEDGKLVLASTRGTGFVGEDITEAMKYVDRVPHEIPWKSLRVRGEAIIPRYNHSYMRQLGYSAMRNAVPGIVKSCRKGVLDCVHFIAYEFFDECKYRSEQRDIYSDYFEVETCRLYESSDFEEILKDRNAYGEEKDSLVYEIDGVVLKTNRIREDDLIRPTHQIAWKFKSNREITTLRGVEYQMGVTGRFTPVGIFDEVEFQGAKLTRASFGNMTRLHSFENKPSIGSIVEVSRRGDIIPYIENIIYNDKFVVPIGKLVTCPHCNSLLQYDGDEPYCAYKQCPEKLRLQLSQYVKAVGVKGIGDTLVRSLIDHAMITSIIDIYRMEPEMILSLPRQGNSAVEKWRALQSKKLSTVEILSAYPFLNLGRKVWEAILPKFSYSEILDLTEDALTSAKIKGVGTSKIKDIVSQVSENREELLWLGNYFGVL